MLWTYLQREELLGLVVGLAAEVARVQDAHDHLAATLDRLERRRRRRVMLVLHRLYLLEDLRADSGHLHTHTHTHGAPLADWSLGTDYLGDLSRSRWNLLTPDPRQDRGGRGGRDTTFPNSLLSLV